MSASGGRPTVGGLRKASCSNQREKPPDDSEGFRASPIRPARFKRPIPAAHSSGRADDAQGAAAWAAAWSTPQSDLQDLVARIVTLISISLATLSRTGVLITTP